jgi:hypothetical protein
MRSVKNHMNLRAAKLKANRKKWQNITVKIRKAATKKRRIPALKMTMSTLKYWLRLNLILQWKKSKCRCLRLNSRRKYLLISSRKLSLSKLAFQTFWKIINNFHRNWMLLITKWTSWKTKFLLINWTGI